MTTASEELRDIATELSALLERGRAREVADSLDALEESAGELARAWSGSSLGYHARVYRADLAPTPPGHHFDQEWGFEGTFATRTSPGWAEFVHGDLVRQIYDRAGSPDTSAAEALSVEASVAFDSCRSAVESILLTAVPAPADHLTEQFLEKLRALRVFSANELETALISRGAVVSRDSVALAGGFRSAPHQTVQAQVVGLRAPVLACQELVQIAELAAAHVERLAIGRPVSNAGGNRIFIGHGRSGQWRILKDFVSDRLLLPHDEFNRVPVAGVTNIQRLLEMLDQAAIAFLVLTAEDELSDGGLQARMNVVHEAGLFQGRLGFARAILMLEEGCEEFSNIEGLGQIRFPAGNIAAAFEEVRRVLEREGISPER